MKRLFLNVVGAASMVALSGCTAQSPEPISTTPAPEPAPVQNMRPALADEVTLDIALIAALEARLEQPDIQGILKITSETDANATLRELVELTDGLQQRVQRVEWSHLQKRSRQSIGVSMVPDLIKATGLVTRGKDQTVAILSMDLESPINEMAESFAKSFDIEARILEAMSARAQTLNSGKPEAEIKSEFERLNIRILNLLRQRSDLIARRVSTFK